MLRNFYLKSTLIVVSILFISILPQSVYVQEEMIMKISPNPNAIAPNQYEIFVAASEDIVMKFDIPMEI